MSESDNIKKNIISKKNSISKKMKSQIKKKDENKKVSELKYFITQSMPVSDNVRI